MSNAAFFAPLITFLETPPQEGYVNTIAYWLSSNRADADRFVMYSGGQFYSVQNANKLVSGPFPTLFSDRFGENFQPFDIAKPESDTLELTTPNGPLVRIDQAGNAVAQYDNFQCLPQGVLLCWSNSTGETVLLTFMPQSTYEL